MTNLAEELSIVERGDVLVISGYPISNEKSRWHVNSSTHFGEGADRRAAIILQRADGVDEFLTITLDREDGDWSIDDFAAFEGRKPPTGDSSGGKAVDPSEIENVRIDG